MPLLDQDTMNALNKISEQSLISLVYVSKITWQSRFQTSVFHSIEATSNKFNKDNNLTGTLCYGNGYFVQCLEGAKSVVLSLLKRIIEDKRHKDLKILVVEPIQSRKFVSWDMRMLFLERWLWSPDTKKQAESLSEFLPFRPYNWSTAYTNKFLSVIQKLDTPAHVNTAGISFNAIGSMLQQVVGPHQAFLVIQGLLSLLVIVALVMLFNVSFL